MLQPALRFLETSEISVDLLATPTGSVPFWNFSTRKRVTPVSIQDGVYHGITFAAISTIPAAPSPISAELSPIPAALSGSLRRSVAAWSPIVAWLAKHHKTVLNIVKHHETLLKHCETSWNTRHSMRRYRRSMRTRQRSMWRRLRLGQRRRRSRGATGDIGVEFPAISAIADCITPHVLQSY